MTNPNTCDRNKATCTKCGHRFLITASCDIAGDGKPIIRLQVDECPACGEELSPGSHYLEIE